MDLFKPKDPEIHITMEHLAEGEETLFTTENLDTALQNAFTTINVFILILIMIAMGAKMKLKHIKAHVQKPLGPLAGFVSQFVLMPLVAFTVAHLLHMKAEHAIGALIMACSPGGVMSNMVTYYTNGDCNLSITMTTLSTLLAFGMMPANLWLYTRSWTKGSTTMSIPYTGILLSLLLILIPVAAGYLFVMKYPNMRSVVAKTGSFSGVLAIVISMVLFFFMNYNLMAMSSLDIWVATAAMPILGFVMGYFLSALFCLTAKQKRTVGFETGCQNASIAFSVISMSFPADVLGSVLLVPLLFCLFSFAEGWIFVIAWQMAKSLRRKWDVWKEEGCVGFEESSDDDSDKDDSDDDYSDEDSRGGGGDYPDEEHSVADDQGQMMMVNAAEARYNQYAMTTAAFDWSKYQPANGPMSAASTPGAPPHTSHDFGRNPRDDRQTTDV